MFLTAGVRGCLRRVNFTLNAGRPMCRNLAQASSSANDVIVGDRAANRFRTVASPGEYLRILVDSGGCSGYEYKFQLVPAPESDDHVIERDGVRIVIDRISLDFIRGATIDYQEELIKSAFRIVQNPRAEKGCSCGSSFALKLDDAPSASRSKAS